MKPEHACPQWDQMRVEWTLPPSSTLDGRGAARLRATMRPCVVGVDRTMKFQGRLKGREVKSRPARIDVSYDAVVRLDWGAIEAVILNVSGKGFRLHTAEELEPGTEVMLEVDKLEPVRGMIRWACGHESGGVFLEAVAL